MKSGKVKKGVVKKRIAVALSGGIDSLVAAFLLKKEYPHLFGIHFTTGYELSPQNIQPHDIRLDIHKKQEEHDIQAITEQLDIPVICVDLKEQFEKDVVSYFIKTYQKGKTPNPCIICNQKIKFGDLYQAARYFGANFLATGHYARVGINPITSSNQKNQVSLLKGKDRIKDQSYFLSMLSPEQLKYALFPLGDFTKQEVIAIAAQNGLVPIHKKESQDICFIHKSSFHDFISSKCTIPLESKNRQQSVSGLRPPFLHGDIVTTDNRVVGRHRGLYCYTIGQRRGLNCPGPAPYYVKNIDMKQNRLIVGFKEELFEKESYVSGMNWLCDSAVFYENTSHIDTTLSNVLTSPLRVKTHIRYNHSGAYSTIVVENRGKSIDTNNNDAQASSTERVKVIRDINNNDLQASSTERVKVIFDEPQFAITPGQCAVFYDGDHVLGAGFIE